jgi:hypothetical protein
LFLCVFAIDYSQPGLFLLLEGLLLALNNFQGRGDLLLVHLLGYLLEEPRMPREKLVLAAVGFLGHEGPIDGPVGALLAEGRGEEADF